MQAPFTLATDGTTLPKEISMSPETLKTYLPSPFHELLDMHEPPTELELDAFLPHLLEKSHSLATGLNRCPSFPCTPPIRPRSWRK
jgi:hypothetical protein